MLFLFGFGFLRLLKLLRHFHLARGHANLLVREFAHRTSSWTTYRRASARRRHRLRTFSDQKRGARGGPPRPGPPAAPGTTRGFIGSRPSRCNFLRASLRARRMASAFSRTL